ncbi:hypothetical protein [Limnohabitans sp. 2KL-27]|uniref:hypothetical protein n=1 Tax=Limnohabitans sp. 2KL-27 TaxID=1100705 RepID=UPI000AD2AFC0|nr:hypothetical protein [Limnohabitans sp. 2KL-27]
MPLFSLSRFGLAAALSILFSTAHADSSIRYCPDFLAVKGAPAPAHRGEITFSPYTHHFSNNPEHKKVVLVALDEQLPGDRLCGISFFSNSFGQPSVYVYAGQQFNNLWGVPQLFAKVTGGIMYGYVSPYENKVPLNHNGFSPAVIPAVGYKLTPHDSVQLQFLGNAALMFSYGRQF